MELYSRKINIWLLQRSVLIVLLHCKKAEEKWQGALPLHSYATVCCKCLGGKNVGTSFNDPKFSSFNPLFSFSPLQSTHYSAQALSLQHWSVAEAPGEFTTEESILQTRRLCRQPQGPFPNSPVLFFLPLRILWDSSVCSCRHLLVLATGGTGEFWWREWFGEQGLLGKCLKV